METKRTGIALIVLGVIAVIIGIALMTYGSQMDGDYERQLESFFDSGHRDNSGVVMHNIGIAVLIGGCIMALIGIILLGTSGNQAGQAAAGSSQTPQKLSGKFINAANSYWLRLDRSGSCVWMQEGKQFTGTYRCTDTNEWTIYIDGFGEAFRFSLMGKDIYVTGGPVNERFYCEVVK